MVEPVQLHTGNTSTHSAGCQSKLALKKVKNYCEPDFVVLQTSFKQSNEPHRRKTQLLVLYVTVQQMLDEVFCRNRSILDSHMCRLKNKTTAETSSRWKVVKDLYLVTQILQMQWCPWCEDGICWVVYVSGVQEGGKGATAQTDWELKLLTDMFAW